MEKSVLLFDISPNINLFCIFDVDT